MKMNRPRNSTCTEFAAGANGLCVEALREADRVPGVQSKSFSTAFSEKSTAMASGFSLVGGKVEYLLRLQIQEHDEIGKGIGRVNSV